MSEAAADAPRPRSSRVRHPIALIVMLVWVATGCDSAGTEPPSRPPALPETVLERLVAEHADDHNAGVIALVENDGRTWLGAAGDYQGREVHPGDLFDAGSVGKTFVATVVFQLVEEGRLSLDDTVEGWLPEEVDGGRRVLIRQLMNHTSGLTVFPSGRIAVVNPPGTVYGYSNVEYGLLGGIVSEVTGRAVGQEVRDRIVDPLGLETWTSRDAASRPWLGAPEVCPCAGPIVTTADLARFFQALLRGELLGPNMMAEMKRTVPTGTEIHSGLGVFRFDLPCGTAWGHGGDFTYYANQVLVSGDGSTAVVVARSVGDWYSLKTVAEEMYCAAA